MSGFANPVAVEPQSEALEEREIAQELGMTDDSDVGSFFRSDALGREKAHQNLHELLGSGTPLADLSPDALESCKLAFTVMGAWTRAARWAKTSWRRPSECSGACLRRMR